MTDEVKAEILTRIRLGESVRQIGRDENMPSDRTIFHEISSNAQFLQQYESAKKDQAEYLGDEMLEIADDGRNDWILREVRGQEIEVQNTEAIQRSRLRIDTRKWLMSKLLPKKYGDKLDIEANHTGSIKVTIGGDV